MNLTETILAAGHVLPAPFVRGRSGRLELEAVIAERKVFLSRRKLTYRCRLRVDDAARALTFYEVLFEKGSGVSASDAEAAPGFGFKKETYSVGGKIREGSIEEQSRLFGRDYDYRFDFGAVRREVERLATVAGYTFEVVLRQKSV